MRIIDQDDVTKPDYALKEYKERSISYEDGKYVAKLPWKQEHPTLPSNYNVTFRRTENTIRRLCKEPKMLQHYGEIIADQERKGFIERVNDVTDAQTRVHYIPHHPVSKQSSTTPIRIVYDCSCRQSRDHASLNDCLESTPPELNAITSILMRFRMNKYAVSADIEKAFLQDQLHKQDHDVTRFLWLSDPNDPGSPLVTYRFRSVLFGATCSPFILSAVISKHLENNPDVAASAEIERNLYVDNVLSSFSNEKDLLSYYSESRHLISGAGMNLRSWCSNNQILRQRAVDDNVLDTDNICKVLGMLWDSTKDKLSFTHREIPTLDCVTKRDVLKYSSRIYDPLGLLSPVTVQAKLLMQDIWKLKVDWDDTLPAEHLQKWNRIATDLSSAQDTQLNRQYIQNLDTNSEPVKLHVFVDASVSANGAAAYICNDQHSRIVIAKNRVAPLKPLTLPKLELMAAVVGGRLAKHIQNSLQVSEVTFWSDSQIVLKWLSSDKQLPRFVKNRVNEIKETTRESIWRYCPTRYNPADLLTRGISARELDHNTLWETGPTWLTNTSKWPYWNVNNTNISTTSTQLEQACFNLETNILPCDIEEHIVSASKLQCSTYHSENRTGVSKVVDINRYSKLSKLLRVTAYVKRFISNCRAPRADRIHEFLTSQEINKAQKIWLRDVQESSYVEEINSMQTKNTHATLVRQLRLFIDEDGYVRCGGRIHNAPVDELTKFPYLLPDKHHYTRLLVQQTHEKLLHSGVASVVAQLRQQYWIPAIRRCAQSVLSKCITCKRVNGRPYTAPDAPPLPKARVENAKPFRITGIDFTGALYVRENDGKESKAYICLFTCASTRAVHLELVSDLSVDTFIQALRRFCNRRSVPEMLMSDNATTFTAASNYVKSLQCAPELHHNLNLNGIDWKFIPKRAPWYGGWWERMIGLTKDILKKVLGRTYVSFQTLSTVVTEIEAVLNDRPLTSVASGTSEPEPLTPSHLIYGRRLTSLPFPINDNVDVTRTDVSDHKSITKQANVQRKLIEHFSQRWRREYLTGLRQHHQATGNKMQTISVGDVVQIHDEIPRLRWKLAVVQQLVPGNDGLVRSAVIRTANGVTNRPITKLYPLEVTQDSI